MLLDRWQWCPPLKARSFDHASISAGPGWQGPVLGECHQDIWTSMNIRAMGHRTRGGGLGGEVGYVGYVPVDAYGATGIRHTVDAAA